MAPKKAQDATTDEKVKALCVLMATAEEFKPDFDAAASVLDIAQPRNVTRKINSIIEPVGYTMRRKKIVKLSDDEDDDNATASTSKTSKKPAGKAKSQAKIAMKKSATRKTPTKVVKSNSDDENSEEDSEEDSEGSQEEDVKEEYSPVTKAIIEAMAGDDVTPDEDSTSDESDNIGENKEDVV